MIYLVYYLAAINCVTFLAYGWDKWSSTKNRSRISEKTLHIMAFIGGTLGAFVGQKVFHHKTIKRSFQWMYWFIVVIQLALIGVYIYQKYQ